MPLFSRSEIPHNGLPGASIQLMKLCALALLGLALFGTTRLRAADDVKLALSLKAQTEFDRVELPAIPVLRDAAACVQSEAGLLPVTAPEDQSLIHFRK